MVAMPLLKRITGFEITPPGNEAVVAVHRQDWNFNTYSFLS